MAFCTVDDVRAIVDTDITDPEIVNLINRSDARIALKINSGSASAALLADLSSTWTAWRCMLKDPEARSLGEYSENRSQALKWLKGEIDDMIATANGGIAVVATRSELS